MPILWRRGAIGRRFREKEPRALAKSRVSYPNDAEFFAQYVDRQAIFPANFHIRLTGTIPQSVFRVAIIYYNDATFRHAREHPLQRQFHGPVNVHVDERKRNRPDRPVIEV